MDCSFIFIIGKPDRLFGYIWEVKGLYTCTGAAALYQRATDLRSSLDIALRLGIRDRLNRSGAYRAGSNVDRGVKANSSVWPGNMVKKGTHRNWASSPWQNGTSRLQASVRDDLNKGFLESQGTQLQIGLKAPALFRDKISQGFLESRLYFEDILYVQAFPLDILITSFSGGFGPQAPSHPGTSWAGDAIKVTFISGTHLRAVLGFHLPSFQGQVEQGTW